MRRTVIAVAAFALLLGGCADGGTSPGSSGTGGQPASATPATGADDLVLRLREPPGLLPPGDLAAVAPVFSLYGDGTLIAGPAPGQTAIWPTLHLSRMSTGEVRQLFQQALDAGLLDPARPTMPAPGPDAPMRIITVATATQRRTTTVPRSDPAVERLVQDLARHAAPTDPPYEPGAVAVIATAGDDPSAPTRPWPLSTLDGQALTGAAAGSTCTVLRGGDIAAARQAVAGAPAGTRWLSDARMWMVRPRPLLPDEHDCADL